VSHKDPKEELVDHLPALRAFARSLVSDAATADDLVQETVMKAWANIDRFQPGTNMKAWLFTILRNTFYSALRKRSWEVEDVDEKRANRLPQKPAQEGHLAMQDFLAALRQLSAEQREALLLVGASGFSYDEAAGMCGCATGTIKSRVNRARERLVSILGLNENEGIMESDASVTAALTTVRGAST